MENKLKFTTACLKFLGKKPADQSLQEFAAEVRKLTPEDRAELTPDLEAELGIQIEA